MAISFEASDRRLIRSTISLPWSYSRLAPLAGVQRKGGVEVVGAGSRQVPLGVSPDGSARDPGAVSSTDVWATGERGSGTLIEHWDGTDWTLVPSPTPPGKLCNPLDGVAIVSAHDIWAVGSSQDGASGSPSTLTEHWDAAPASPVG
jgi:hypothetical protein